jgi:hypothetical protein
MPKHRGIVAVNLKIGNKDRRVRWGWARCFPSVLSRSFFFGWSPGNLFSSSLARKRYVDEAGLLTVAGLIVATADAGCV